MFIFSKKHVRVHNVAKSHIAVINSKRYEKDVKKNKAFTRMKQYEFFYESFNINNFFYGII